MRTTIALDDELIRQAEHYTGIKEKAALVREALTRLVRGCPAPGGSRGKRPGRGSRAAPQRRT